MGKNKISSIEPENLSRKEANIRDDTLEAVYKGSQFDRPHDRRWSTLGSFLLAAVIGAMTAMFALFAIITGSIKGVPFFDRLDVAAFFSPMAPITISRTERVTVTSEERIAEVTRRIPPMLYGVYLKKDLTDDATGLMQSAGTPRAHAISLTSNGWLLSAGELSEVQTGDISVVSSDGKSFAVERRTQDSATGLWFLKVDASTMVAASLSRDTPPLLPGTQVLLAVFRVGRTSLISHKTVEGVVTLPYRDTDRLEARVRLPLPVSGMGTGVPAVNLAGEVVAIVSLIEGDNAFAVPIANVASVFEQVFNNGSILRPSVGLRYFELSNVADLAFSLTRGRRQGALLVNNGSQPSVSPKSNAAAAGLQEGDIIIKVEGELVREETDLATLLQSYPPTAKVKLTVVRGGEERLVDVLLSPPASSSKK